MKLKTIVLLVAPSCSGKSRFAKKIKEAAESEFLSCAILSSDEIRRELLCDSGMHKMHAKMMSVSNEAFTLLNQRLDYHTRYPINTDVVVVDTTGLSEEFRNSILAIADKNHYKIVLYGFDFTFSVLEKFIESGQGDRFVSSKHHKKFREEVLPKLNRKAYSEVKIFKSPEEVDKYQIEFEEDGAFNCEFVASDNEKIAVVSDVHECVKELTELLSIKQMDSVRHLVFCGDLFDKGENTALMLDMLETIRDNFKSVYFVRGNHERYVYRRLTGEIQPNEFLENGYFTSLKVFLNDEAMKTRFMKFYEESMVPYVRFDRGMNKGVVVTHAPCKTKYIGKMDSVSVGKMANFYFSSRDRTEMVKDVDFIMQEAHVNHDYHVFGHMAHDGRKPHQYKNKIFLDTGCVHGNKLSVVVFNGRYVDFVSVDSSFQYEPLPTFIIPKTETNTIDKILSSSVKLSDDEEKMVNRVIRGGTKYVSGTMAPAPSTETDLESLEEGLKIFQAAGCSSVILQPKYMGSRCQVYLRKDGKHAAYSRNGFKIRILGIEEYLETLVEKYEHLYQEELILDGELLPWAALGSGLINDHFNQYAVVIEDQVLELQNDDVFQGFDIGKKWKSEHHDVNIQLFKKQLEIYGNFGELEFKPFSILSVDGECQLGKNEAVGYSLVNSSEKYLELNFSDEKWLQIATEFFSEYTLEKFFEGVVIKPVVWNQNLLPYMKVRNKEYLRLVYGYDYNNRNEVLCKQKGIKKKSQLSMEEFIIGKAMLETTDVEVRNKLIAAMFGKISQEKTLDPRL